MGYLVNGDPIRFADGLDAARKERESIIASRFLAQGIGGREMPMAQMWRVSQGANFRRGERFLSDVQREVLIGSWKDNSGIKKRRLRAGPVFGCPLYTAGN